MALFSKKGKDASEAAPVTMPVAPDANGTVSNGTVSDGTVNGTSGAASEDFSDFSETALAGAGADADGGKKKRFARVPKGPKPARPKGLKGGSVVGLNIGNDSIKVVELRGKGTSVAVTAMGMVPTPQDSISNGVVMSTAALSRAIRDVFQSAGVKSKNVVSSVSGTGSLIVRIIEVPKMSDSELADNMKVDLDRYIPFPPSEVIMDFKALRELPTDPDAANMEVLLAAAQREVVDAHVKVLQGAKLTPQAIDVEPLAAARGLFYGGAGGSDEMDYDDVSALVNIGATGTEISVMRGDVLVFTRSIPGGGNALTDALVSSLGMAWPDAERLKIDSGDALSHHATAAYGAAPASQTAYGTSATGSTTFGSPRATTATSTVAATGAGDDWSNFDAYAASPDASTSTQDVFGANTLAPPSSTVAATPIETVAGTAPAVTPEASGDPFDMDFFNQGPRQNEPEEQHQQKNDAPGDAANVPRPDDDFDFSSFDFDAAPASDAPHADDTPDLQIDESDAAASASHMSTHVAGTQAADAAPASNFDFSMPASDAPASTAPSGQMFHFGAADNPSLPFPSLSGNALDDDFASLPTVAEDDSLANVSDAGSGNAGVASGGSAPATGFSFDDFTIPETTATATSPTVTSPTAAEPIFGTEASPLATTTSASSAAMPSVYDAGELSGGASPAVSGAQTANAFPATGFETVANPGVTGHAATAPATDDFDFESLSAPAGVGGSAVVGETGFGAADPGTTNSGVTTFGAAPSADAFAGDAFGGDAFGGDAFATGDDFNAGGFGADLSGFGAGLGSTATGVTSETLHGIMQPLLDELVGEVRRSLEYYASRYPDAGVRRVTLVGGGAKLTNIDAFFTQSLGIPTTTGNPLARLALRAKQLPPGYGEENGPIFAVALGLALRDLA